MTELEQLQHGVDESVRQQRLKELLALLTKLGDDVEKALKENRGASIVWLLGWTICVGTDFIDSYLHTGDTFWKVGVIVYVVGLTVSGYYERRLAKAFSAYLAAVQVLEVLGIIDARTPPGVKNKKKRVQALIELVKSWAVQKQKAQEEMYQPA